MYIVHTYIIDSLFSQRILLVELAEFSGMPLKAIQSFPTAVIPDA